MAVFDDPAVPLTLSAPKNAFHANYQTAFITRVNGKVYGCGFAAITGFESHVSEYRQIPISAQVSDMFITSNHGAILTTEGELYYLCASGYQYPSGSYDLVHHDSKILKVALYGIESHFNNDGSTAMFLDQDNKIYSITTTNATRSKRPIKSIQPIPLSRRTTDILNFTRIYDGFGITNDRKAYRTNSAEESEYLATNVCQVVGTYDGRTSTKFYWLKMDGKVFHDNETTPLLSNVYKLYDFKHRMMNQSRTTTYFPLYALTQNHKLYVINADDDSITELCTQVEDICTVYGQIAVLKTNGTIQIIDQPYVNEAYQGAPKKVLTSDYFTYDEVNKIIKLKDSNDKIIHINGSETIAYNANLYILCQSGKIFVSSFLAKTTAVDSDPSGLKGQALNKILPLPSLTYNIGYYTSPLRERMNEVYNCMPDDLKNIIAPCPKYTGNIGITEDLLSGDLRTDNQTVMTEDKIFLPSEYEILGKVKYTNQIDQTGEIPSPEHKRQQQYDYFVNGKTLQRSNLSRIGQQGASTAGSVARATYWTRSQRYANEKISGIAISSDIQSSVMKKQTKSLGIAPCFAIISGK